MREMKMIVIVIVIVILLVFLGVQSAQRDAKECGNEDQPARVSAGNPRTDEARF
jgi:uncharacterized MAPEG superfamily protein